MSVLWSSIFCILQFLVPLSYCGVPVLIWESSSTNSKADPVPALAQMDSDEFSNHIVKKVHANKPLVVLFLEESLSVEDFSWRDEKHKGSFPQIQNISTTAARLEFLPSVEDPVDALKGLILDQGFEWKKYDPSKLPNKKGIVLEVRLKDAKMEEDRPELLRRHDGDVADIYSRLLAEHSHVIAILTGKMSAWVEPDFNRVRRETGMNETTTPASEVTTEKQPAFDIANKLVLMHSSQPPKLVEGSDTVTLTSKEDMSPDFREAYSRMPIKMYGGKSAITLRFRFDKKGNDWDLPQVEFVKDGKEETPLKPSSAIGASIGKSFEANSMVEFKNENVKLIFDNLKVEPWPKSISAFSKTEDKEQFFTETIWSGIFVTFILGLIFAWGITMLLDIRTMDRFDDPKGKTISVNVNE